MKTVFHLVLVSAVLAGVLPVATAQDPRLTVLGAETQGPGSFILRPGDAAELVLNPGPTPGGEILLLAWEVEDPGAVDPPRTTVLLREAALAYQEIRLGFEVPAWLAGRNFTLVALRLDDDGEYYRSRFISVQVVAKGGTPGSIIADINQDGVVDEADHIAFLAAMANQDLVGDLNHDGRVDILDYNIFLAAYNRFAA